MHEKQKPVIIIAFITALCLIGDSMLYVVLPSHWKVVGLTSIWEVGFILSINRFIRLPLGPLAGLLYRRMSKKTGMLIAIILAIVSTTSYGLVHSFLGWIFLRVLWGGAWTLLRMGAYLTIVDLSDETNRGRLMGTYNGLYRIGSLVGMLGGGLLVDTYGITLISIIFGLIPMIALPFFIIYVSGSLSKKPVVGFIVIEKTKKTISFIRLISNSHISAFLLTGLLITMIFEGMFTASLTHLIEIRESSIVYLFGLSLGAATLSGILQSLRWMWGPWLSPWIGKKTDELKNRKALLNIMLLIAAALFFILPVHMPLVIWIFIVIGALLTSTILTTIMDSLASDLASNHSKVFVITVYTIAIDIGAALGPILGYTVGAYFNEMILLWVAGSILLFLSRLGTLNSIHNYLKKRKYIWEKKV